LFAVPTEANIEKTWSSWTSRRVSVTVRAGS
jgi:hypothetical protein